MIKSDGGNKVLRNVKRSIGDDDCYLECDHQRKTELRSEPSSGEVFPGRTGRLLLKVSQDGCFIQDSLFW